MKKLFTFLVLICSFTLVKAQRPQVDIVNNTGTNLSVVLYGHTLAAPPCSVNTCHTVLFGLPFPGTTAYDVSTGVLMNPAFWVNPPASFPAGALVRADILYTSGGVTYGNTRFFCTTPPFPITLTFPGSSFTCTMQMLTTATKHTITLTP